MRPHPKMLDDSIQYSQIFIVPFLKVFLDFVRVVPFSHEAVGDLIDFVVPIAGDLISYILDIHLVPVFLFVDVRKGRLESVEFAAFEYAGQVMMPGYEMSIPLHEYPLLDALQLCDLATEYAKQRPSAFVVEFVPFVGSDVPDVIEAAVIDLVDLVIVDGFDLVDEVIDCKSVEFQAVEDVLLEPMLVFISLVPHVRPLSLDEVQVPLPSHHRVSHHVLLSLVQHRLDFATVGDSLEPDLLEAHKNISNQSPMPHSRHLHTYQLTSLFNLFPHFLLVVVKVVQAFLNFSLLELSKIYLPQT